MSGVLVLLLIVLVVMGWLALARRESEGRNRAHRAVVCLISGQQLLVMQEVASKRRRGPSELPKGRIKQGETALMAAHRECFEESGLCPEVLQFLTSLQVRRGRKRRRERWDVFWGEVPAAASMPFEHRVSGKGNDQGRRYVFSLRPLDQLDASALRPPLGEVLPALRDQLAPGRPPPSTH